MSNFLSHSKFHQANHHTIATPGLPDSATDPIASQSEPFQGVFHNYLNALLNLSAINVSYLETILFPRGIVTFDNLSINTIQSIYAAITANVFTNSKQWFQMYTNINTLSTVYGLYPTVSTTVNTYSGNWNRGYNFYSSLSLLSTNYLSTYTMVNSYSANWPFIDTTLRLNLVQQNTHSKNFSGVNITDISVVGANVSAYWNLSAAQCAFFRVTGDTVFKNIVNSNNKKKGGEYTLVLQQDGFGNRNVSFGTDYVFSLKYAPFVAFKVFSPLPTTNIWSSIFFDSDTWVAVTKFDFWAALSTDGINWTASLLPGNHAWTTVTYGVSAWLALADFHGVAARSTDNAVTWDAVALPVTARWTSVAYGGNTFIAVASGTNRGIRSTDYGQSWTTFNLPVSAAWSSVSYGDNKWIAVAGGVENVNNTLNATISGAISTTNGTTWQLFKFNRSQQWSDVKYNGNCWLAVARYTRRINRSTNGTSWVEISASNDEGYGNLAYSQATWLATSNLSGDFAFSNNNGTTWGTVPNTKKYYYNQSAYGKKSYVSIGQDRKSPFPIDESLVLAETLLSENTDVVSMTALSVTVIRFTCDGNKLYGKPTSYYYERDTIWTYFAGPGLIFTPNPAEFYINDYFIPTDGLTVAGVVVPAQGYSNGGGITVVEGLQS